jgi:hypothetical protein
LQPQAAGTQGLGRAQREQRIVALAPRHHQHLAAASGIALATDPELDRSAFRLHAQCGTRAAASCERAERAACARRIRADLAHVPVVRFELGPNAGDHPNVASDSHDQHAAELALGMRGSRLQRAAERGKQPEQRSDSAPTSAALRRGATGPNVAPARDC